MRPDKSLTPFEIRLYKHYRVVHGCRIALAFVLTFVLVRLLDIPEGTWPLITLVVVMGPISFWGNVVPRAFERIGGTVLGSALGLIALKLELISFPFMLLWCAVAMFLCGWLALGKKTVSGAADWHYARGCGRRTCGRYDHRIVAKRGRDPRLVARHAVYRHLAAARLPALAHSDGKLRHGI